MKKDKRARHSDSEMHEVRCALACILFFIYVIVSIRWDKQGANDQFLYIRNTPDTNTFAPPTHTGPEGSSWKVAIMGKLALAWRKVC